MNTLVDFFNYNTDRFGGNVYLWENRGAGYQGTTYGEVRREVHCFGAGLVAMGIEKGDRIGLLSEARNDWIIAEFGIFFAGAVSVPISVRISEPAELKFRLNHSGARSVVVSENQVQKILQIWDELETVETVILLDESYPLSGKVLLFSDICARGDTMLQTRGNDFEARPASVAPGDMASISYTSGTTSDPKGIILTHRNFMANIEQGYSLMDITPGYVTLLILPWDHAFAHTAGIFCFMGRGASIASLQRGKSSLESLKYLPKNLGEIRPSLLFTVPAIAANLKKGIVRSVEAKGKLTGKLFSAALKIAYYYNGEGFDRGQGLKTLLKPLIWWSDRFLFRKIRQGFGGRLEFFIGGGALLDIEFQKFFYAIGIPMLQGYGLTEAAPFISSNSLKSHKLGSSGRLVANLELKICNGEGASLATGETGEIVIRGDNVMAGYWKNEDATAGVLRDGWLHTGDMGAMDRDGFLYVSGRFKSLLIANDGEKYSPEGMEEAFSAQSAFILQCMLYNNQDPYTVMLLVPDRDALVHALHLNGLDPGTAEGMTAGLRLLEQEIRQYRSGGKFGDMFPQRWLPTAIGVLGEPFTEENHLLNFQLKIVRSRILEKYRSTVEFMYTPAGKNMFNEPNMKAISEVFRLPR